MSGKLTHKIFLEKANKVHNNFYSYPEEYVRSNQKLKICCPIHGIFEQTPKDHLRGCGCQKCSRIKKTTESFNAEADEIHGGKYKYHLVKYENCKTPVIIWCPKHGEFEQSPETHLIGSGCPKCGYGSPTTLELIDRFVAVHGNRYDYTHVVFNGFKNKVEIYCNDCQKSFWIKPWDHLDGHGCSECNMSKGEYQIREILRKLSIKYEPEYTDSLCRNVLPLPFDFGILDEAGNLVGLVEYQGKQHFEHVNFSGKFTEEVMQKNLVQCQKTDKIKKDWCKSNGIPLLELIYTEDKDLEKNLQKFLRKIFKKSFQSILKDFLKNLAQTLKICSKKHSGKVLRKLSLSFLRKIS